MDTKNVIVTAAAYLAKLRASGHTFRPLTDAELAVWNTGAPMPGFAHICMDGNVVVGEPA